MSARHPDARILIVDDEPANLVLMDRVLRSEGYTDIRCVSDSRQVLPIVLSDNFDLIVLDLRMPYLDGITILRQLAPRVAETLLPVIVMTAHDSPQTRAEALEAGAKDYLSRPIDTTEVSLRIRNHLETRYLHRALRDLNSQLQQRVLERTRDLEAAQVEILDRLALAAEFRDDASGEHTQRVGAMSAEIALELGLPKQSAELYRRAAPLHDVGKIGIPDRILLKPGALTGSEFEVVKTHTVIGARILSGGSFPLLQLAEEIALTHHEHWDGTGYCPGLAGESIPLSGRIVAVADVYDALTQDRPYKPAWPAGRARAEIRSLAGSKFDPRVVAAFDRVLERTVGGAPPVPGPSGSQDRSVRAVLETDGLCEAAAVMEAELTPREREVLDLVAEGASNKEIGERLFVTEATVKTHVTRILQKLGFRDRTSAAVWRLRRRSSERL